MVKLKLPYSEAVPILLDTCTFAELEASGVWVWGGNEILLINGLKTVSGLGICESVGGAFRVINVPNQSPLKYS